MERKILNSIITESRIGTKKKKIIMVVSGVIKLHAMMICERKDIAIREQEMLLT